MGKPTFSFPISIFVQCPVGRKYPHYEISTFTACRKEYLLEHFGPTEILLSTNYLLQLHQNPTIYAIILSVKIKLHKDSSA